MMAYYFSKQKGSVQNIRNLTATRIHHTGRDIQAQLLKMSKLSPTWDGNAMTQEDMMIKDTVLVLDNDDNVIGSASKRTSHEFTSEQARGILHRAFSVFLFDESTGELLLQQRASSKITFPKVSVDRGQ